MYCYNNPVNRFDPNGKGDLFEAIRKHTSVEFGFIAGVKGEIKAGPIEAGGEIGVYKANVKVNLNGDVEAYHAAFFAGGQVSTGYSIGGYQAQLFEIQGTYYAGYDSNTGEQPPADWVPGISGPKFGKNSEDPGPANIKKENGVDGGKIKAAFGLLAYFSIETDLGNIVYDWLFKPDDKKDKENEDEKDSNRTGDNKR